MFNYSGLPDLRDLFDLAKEEKPVIRLIASGEQFDFNYLNLTINFSFEEKPMSWFEPPKTYKELIRVPSNDSIHIEIKGLNKNSNHSNLPLLKNGVIIDRIINLNEKAPYDAFNFGNRDGAFIIIENNILSEIDKDKIKINLLHLKQQEYI